MKTQAIHKDMTVIVKNTSKGIPHATDHNRIYRESGIAIQNRSQPCGLTNSRNWEPFQSAERKHI